MISTSPVDHDDQNRPVTTTHTGGGRDLVAQLHTFITERVLERVAEAGVRGDWAGVDEHLRGLRVLDVMYAATKRYPEQVSTTLQHLHTVAAHDRHHEDFRPEWCGAPRLSAQARFGS